MNGKNNRFRTSSDESNATQWTNISSSQIATEGNLSARPEEKVKEANKDIKFFEAQEKLRQDKNQHFKDAKKIVAEILRKRANNIQDDYISSLPVAEQTSGINTNIAGVRNGRRNRNFVEALNVTPVQNTEVRQAVRVRPFVPNIRF